MPIERKKTYPVIANTVYISFLLLLFLFASSCSIHNPPAASPDTPSCVSPEDCLKAALADKKAGNAEASKKRLLDIRKRFRGTLWPARASLLLGIQAAASGEADASAYFDGAEGLEHINDYVLFYRAAALRADKRPAEAVFLYDSLIASYPASALISRAMYEKALALEETGNISIAKEAMEDFISSSSDKRDPTAALIKIAEYSIRMNDLDAAVKALREALTRYPAGEGAKEAETMKAALMAGGAAFPEYGAEELWLRARAFFGSADYKNASEELSTLLKMTAPEDELYDPASILFSVAQIRLKRYSAAGKALRNYLKSSPRPQNEPEALYWLSLVSLRQEDEAGLIETEKALAQRFPQSRERAETIVFLARLYEGRGDLKRALEAYRLVRSEFSGERAAEEARWRTGWIHYRAGRFTDAYSALKAVYRPGGREKDADKYLYWAARSAENLGNGIEAASLYEKLCREYPRGFYCMLSAIRFGQKTPPSKINDNASLRVIMNASFVDEEPDEGKNEDKNIKGPALASDERYLAATELLTLGLNKEASAEIGLLAAARSGEPLSLIEAAKLFLRAGDFHRALRTSTRCLPGGSGSGPGVEDALKISYPLEVVAEVKEHKADAEVDPLLVASIMREESAFDPDAVSRTGALGLMQIMPDTGEAIAKELGWKKGVHFDAKELLKSPVSIRFGSWYLGELYRRFEKDLVMTVAGYNAGPSAAARWARTRPVEDDEFIESIPYPETRSYVKKVISSYGEYLRLSGADPAKVLKLNDRKGGEKKRAEAGDAMNGFKTEGGG